MQIPRPESAQKIPPEAQRVFAGILFDVYQWQQPMYDGSTATFERLRRPDTVIVFPVLPDGRVLLSRQEQPGKSAVFTGAFGGRMEEGEEPLAAAQRELREESGYEADEWVLWDAQQPVGKLDWAVYTFVAKGAHKVSTQELDGGEKIEPMAVTFDEMLDIATRPGFYEREVIPHLVAAKYDAEKRRELKTLFGITE
jgi:8-oxo-dGTP pyrophosphatase MutT (NUDIX family)